MYKWEGRVRYSEADRSGSLSMQGLLRLFQDVSYLHAQDRGLGVAFTARTRCTWFLLSWQVQTGKMPPLGSVVTVETAFTYLHASLGRKMLWLRDASGALCAAAETSWAYVNVDRQQPVNAPTGQWQAEDALTAEEAEWLQSDRTFPPFARGRLRMPPPPVKPGTPIPIAPWMLDTNGHVNNVRLTETAMIAGGCSFGCRALRAEFRRQVFPTDQLCPVVCPASGQSPRTDVQMFANGKEAAVFSFF